MGTTSHHLGSIFNGHIFRPLQNRVTGEESGGEGKSYPTDITVSFFLQIEIGQTAHNVTLNFLL